MKAYIARDCGGALYLYDEMPKVDPKWGDTYYAEFGNSILLWPYRFSIGYDNGWEKFNGVDFDSGPVEVEIDGWHDDIKADEIRIIE